MLTLIIGGAGSGKSAFAERLVENLSGQRFYLATMEAEDKESMARIRRHRSLREDRAFTTIELGHGLEKLEVPQEANLLLEDLSNLLANEIYGLEGGGAEAVRRGLEHLYFSCTHLTIVTNEVFSGGIEYGEEILSYLKKLADLNRGLAAQADLVVEVVCGLPNVLKGKLP